MLTRLEDFLIFINLPKTPHFLRNSNPSFLLVMVGLSVYSRNVVTKDRK
jgi:hypothetical protein